MKMGPTDNAGKPGNSDQSPAVTALLRSMYAPPSNPAYWSGLEQRIISRLRENGPVAWWAVFSEWRSAGMIAAAVALAGCRCGDRARTTEHRQHP